MVIHKILPTCHGALVSSNPLVGTITHFNKHALLVCYYTNTPVVSNPYHQVNYSDVALLPSSWMVIYKILSTYHGALVSSNPLIGTITHFMNMQYSPDFVTTPIHL
jgi:hypothetical protein